MPPSKEFHTRSLPATSYAYSLLSAVPGWQVPPGCPEHFVVGEHKAETVSAPPTGSVYL